MAQQPLVGQGPPFSRFYDHIQTHHIGQESFGRVTSPRHTPLPDNTQHSHETVIHGPGGFEPAIPARARPQTHALDRATTETGTYY